MKNKIIMKKEEKRLLLKVICAMLPYGLKGRVKTIDGNGHEIIDDGVINSVFINEHGKAYVCINSAEYELEDVKPYLRFMSFMTEEESKRFALLQAYYVDGLLYPSGAYDMVNWLNKNKFDYYGLISMGLALYAPNDMYVVKK